MPGSGSSEDARARSAPTALRAALDRPLEAAPVPLCPELQLWMLSERVDLDTACAELADLEHPPFWAFAWVGGQALARFVLDHPEHVRDRRVIDFGAGSGLVALAAARAGALSVLAVDADPVAREAIVANAELNHTPLRCDAALPAGSETSADWDVLLAADVLYDGSARERLGALFATGLAPTQRAWIADPERDESHRIELCATQRVVDRIEARTYPDVDGPRRAAFIYAL